MDRLDSELARRLCKASASMREWAAEGKRQAFEGNYKAAAEAYAKAANFESACARLHGN